MSEDANPSAEEAGPPGKEATPEAPQAARFATLLLAAVGVTGALALALFLIFAALGLSGAPYWAVAVAVVGGIVMRRRLLTEASATQTVLFTVCTIGGAVGGLWLAQVLLS